MSRVSESNVEDAVLDWFRGLGYAYEAGPDLSPGGERPERDGFDVVILEGRFRAALARLNPDTPASGIDEAARRVLHGGSPSLVSSNRAFHEYLRDGVDVAFHDGERIKGDKVWLFDFENPENNDWLVVNQFTVTNGPFKRRPDVLLFVNGLPLAVIELKNPGDEGATLKGAWNQIETYKTQIPSLFQTNEVIVISDGLQARHGTISSRWERFLPWRTIEGDRVARKGDLELEVLIRGIFDKRRLLDLVRNFVVFEDEREIVKKMAAYHQYHAVNKAVGATLRAAGPGGDKRIGVVWHTQGSGKSISMVFYAAKVTREPAMENPTIVVLTDRNDLDDQLLGTFGLAKDLLPPPKQATSRKDLKRLLNVASGGIVFTTVQKFFPQKKGTKYPTLSNRRNIVVIADEAHRSQYDFIDGFAKHIRDALPNASFIGFTGTPIDAEDKSTRQVFGDYIDVYDMQRAVEDGATVRIYYESRLAKLQLDPHEAPRIDADVEEVTEDLEEEAREKLKTKWARLEALVGAKKRIDLVAQDIVEHFERRTRIVEGKGMIVCMSRRICVELYDAIVKLRPDWQGAGDDEGVIKVVMTGDATDPKAFQPHLRGKQRQKEIQNRLKDPKDSLKLVIVRDMWLTGFDAPVLHTMYVDKPMKGHTLMQAVARVNRVFKDKPGGLVVDYLGVADSLRRALQAYSEGSRAEAGAPIEQALAKLQEFYETVAAMLHGVDYSTYATGGHANQMKLLLAGFNKVVGDPETKQRFIEQTTKLRRVFGIAGSHERAAHLRDDIAYFLDIRGQILKHTVTGVKETEEVDSAIQQIVSRAVSGTEVIDIFKAAGMHKPDISILSDEFLAEIRKLPYRNVQLEILQRLLKDEIQVRSRKNVIEARSFREMLERTIAKYQNRAIEAAQVIDELVKIAKDMQKARERGERLNMTEEEIAFYDALAAHETARDVMGDETLVDIARQLVDTIRANVNIDWTMKESVRARLRTAVKRLLRRHGYPPDKAQAATETVIETAETLCRDWPLEMPAAVRRTTGRLQATPDAKPDEYVPTQLRERLAAAGKDAWAPVIDYALGRVLAVHNLDDGNVRVVEDHEDDEFYAYTVLFRYPGAAASDNRAKMGAIERTFWTAVEDEAARRAVSIEELRAELALAFEEGT